VTPLHVTVELSSPLYLPGKWIALDALLASQVALRAGLVAIDIDHLEPVEIPVAKEPGGRFHLCSVSFGEALTNELQHTNRRPPIEQYQMMANDKLRRVDIRAGANKGYRIPRPVAHYDRLEWWCIGDADSIGELLATVTHLGKKRSVGLGRVERWMVEPCATWPGFPVVRDEQPLRPLPLDWPGLRRPARGFHCLTYPYWHHDMEHLCAVPSAT
jgi:hypothetical protein